MKEIPVLDFPAFAEKYCVKQVSTPATLLARLKGQEAMYGPDGWVMLECHMMDSSRLGELTILPYGPRNSLKGIPDGPVSPRGLASDMSVAVAVCKAPLP